MVLDLVVRLVKAPEKKRGDSPPALCVHQKIGQPFGVHQQTPPGLTSAGLTRYKRWPLRTQVLGKFDSKDFCCIVDWRQKLKKIELSNLFRVSRVGPQSGPGLGLRESGGGGVGSLDVLWQES